MYQDRFDETEWSYGCCFRRGGDPDTDYTRHLSAMTEVALQAQQAKRRLAILIRQEPGYPVPSASWRKQVAYMTSQPCFRTIVCAIVSVNPLLRGVVTALNWLRHREYEEAIFGDMDSALTFLERTRGEPLPALRRTVTEWIPREAKTG